MTKRKHLEGDDDLKDSMRHLDEVSARIARMLAELSAPKQPLDEGEPPEA